MFLKAISVEKTEARVPTMDSGFQLYEFCMIGEAIGCAAL